jgi:CRISPR-associated protein Cas2
LQWIVVYDITDDNLRQKVSERLKDYGLERIQYSAFQGELARHVQRSLETDIRKLLNDGIETDSVICFPLCNSCFQNRRVIGAKKELKKDEEKVVVF